jgi:AcrR family transcriptional regulator
MERAIAKPTRWRRSAPIQQRSRETMDRFAEAAEELLRERPFEEISVQEIAAHAERPIGSFYARFASKDALLPFLYERYHEGLEEVFTTRLGRHDWEALDFLCTVEAIVDFLLGIYDERRWLIRALALFARMQPDALPRDFVAQRRRIFDLPAGILARHAERIAHADPQAAARFGVLVVSSVIREKLLFGLAPHARVTPLTRRELRSELIHVLHSYLACEAAP